MLRSLGQLRNVWRSAPLPPSRYEQDVPAALDQLVLELLQLDRSARPNSAAEVMERLSGAAAYPGWRTTFAIGRAHYRRLQGDLAGALEAIAPAVRDAAMGSHMDWGWAAATQLSVLTALGAQPRRPSSPPSIRR